MVGHSPPTLFPSRPAVCNGSLQWQLAAGLRSLQRTRKQADALSWCLSCTGLVKRPLLRSHPALVSRVA